MMTSRQPARDRKRILAVDDDPRITGLVKSILELDDRFEVREENASPRALNAAKEFRPDMVFLDVNMPQLDGGSVASLFKEHESLRCVAVVFLTGTVSKDEVQSLQGVVGGRRFLAKPVVAEELLDTVQTVLGCRPEVPCPTWAGGLGRMLFRSDS
jgi:CheY-like chemotaxis protein